MRTVLIAFLILLISFVTPAFATNWCDSATGCYTFEGDATESLTDSSSNGHDLTNSNSSVLTSGTKCWDSSGCYEFDGTSDKNLNVITDDFNITTEDISLTAWIYADSYGEGSYGNIMGFSNSTSSGWVMYIYSGNNSFYGTFFDATFVGSSYNSVRTGGLRHLAFTRSGGDAITYVNGVNKGSTAAMGNCLTNTGEDLKIGNRDTTMNRAFDGGIDEVGIFVGTELSITDINDIMDNGLVQDTSTRRVMMLL